MPTRDSLTVLLLAISIMCLSCSGSRSTAPSTTPPPEVPSIAAGTAFTLRSAATDELVPGAGVALSALSLNGAFSASYTTNGAGQFQLDRPVLMSSRPLLEITAPGFLLRSTVLRLDEPTITLWPSSSPTGLDEDFSATIGYSSSVCPAANTSQAVLRKLLSSVATAQVVLADALRADSAAAAAHTQAVSRLNLALGDQLQFEVTTAATAGAVVFTADLDPTQASCVDDGLLHAVTQLSLSGFNIVGGRVSYCSIGAARSATLVLHELGHTTGLYHSASTSDVMYCSAGRPLNFSSRERLVMKLARGRRSGNRWPDNDRQASTLLVEPEGRMERIACSEANHGR
jgi:hypothetical protein